MRPPKVLINVTHTMPVKGLMGGYVSGVGQSIISYVNALNQIDNIPFEIELYATTFQARKCNFYDWKFKHHILPLPTKLKWKERLLDSYFRHSLYGHDLFHITENYFDVAHSEPFVVTIHECTDLDNKINSDIDRKLIVPLRKKYENMVNMSRSIVAVSEFSKQEIVEYLNADPQKVQVVYWGIDKERFSVKGTQEVHEILSRYGIERPYFFACSCNRPRKNLVTALRAFKKFLTYNPHHIFVVAWHNPYKEIIVEFAKEIEERKIIFLPFLTDEELVSFYNGASMSVYVSLKEGFGLPILESFACGTPVMTCRNSSLEEVGQDAAIYVGEYNIDEMVDVMRMFETETYDLDKFHTLAAKVTEQFTWQKTANKYLEVYEKSIY